MRRHKIRFLFINSTDNWRREERSKEELDAMKGNGRDDIYQSTLGKVFPILVHGGFLVLKEDTGTREMAQPMTMFAVQVG